MIDVDFSYVPESILKIKNELIEPAGHALAALKEKTCSGKEWTGWFDFPKTTGLALAKDIKSYVKGLTIDYDLVVVVGIGGSYLGARAVYDALSNEYQLCLGKKDKRHISVVFAGQH